ncbi:MAG TPA: ATP-binding protein [Caulobacterales bacterium]|nr:ATP-binding protein [Caulobacterales bacterium]
MKLGAKFACALIATFLCLFGAAWLILDHLVRAEFRQIEAQQHDDDVRRVNAGLSRYEKELIARVSDYADWDDTRAFLLGAAPNYPAANFTPSWFANYDVDLALFVDAKGAIAWGRNRAGDGGLETGDFLFNIVLSQARTASASVAKPALGVAWTQHGPLFYAARPARNSMGDASPVGLVVIGQYLTAARLREQTQLDLDVFNIVSPGADVSVRAGLKRLADTNLRQVGWAEGGRRVTLIALRGADGRAVGAILARHAKALNPLGERSIVLTAAWLAVLLALALVVLWRVIESQIVSRLRALERHFDGQGDDLKPAPQPQSNDEIGRLVGAFNGLVNRTRQALAREQQAVLDREAHAHAYQIKTAFIANMSHELRTPLTAIMGYCDLVQEDMRASGLESGSADLAKIERSARDLLGMIEEILDMSKLERDEIDIQANSFDVAQMLKTAADRAMPAARANGNTLTLQCLGPLGFARTDEARLRQCVANLLSNACKFTRGGEIVLRAERMRIDNANWLRVEVHDSGIGMSTEQITHIFEPFMQVDNSNTRRYGGMGLGLAITKRLVNLLGGTIAVRSRQGFGTMFVVSVPAALETGASKAAA